MSDHTVPTPGIADDGDRPLEPLLLALAEDYHRPPAPPREAMWAAIRAAREADRAGDLPAAPADDVVALPPVALVVTPEEARAAGGRPRGRPVAGRRWAGPIAALAATLLLGVGLGRWAARADGPSGASGTGAPVATTGGATTGGATTGGATPAGEGGAGAPPRSNDRADAGDGRDRIVAAGGGTSPAAAADPAAGRGAPPRVQDAPAVARARNRNAAGVTRPAPVRLAAADPVAPLAAPRSASPDAARPDAGAHLAATYRVATVQHLGQAEALLTAFRVEPGAGAATIAATDAWARELLTSTRLLLDSPAAADPQLGPLLGDLEAVLVQIVHLPAARAATERRLIAHSLDQSQLMTHLRAAVPSGPAAPQRSGE